MKIFLSGYFVENPLSHRTYYSIAGREFKNPTTLDMRQTNDHVGIKNPTKYHALEARLAFCAHMSRAAERRNAKVKLRKANKIKTDKALRKSGKAVHSTLIQKLDPRKISGFFM